MILFMFQIPELNHLKMIKVTIHFQSHHHEGEIIIKDQSKIRRRIIQRVQINDQELIAVGMRQEILLLESPGYYLNNL